MAAQSRQERTDHILSDRGRLQHGGEVHPAADGVLYRCEKPEKEQVLEEGGGSGGVRTKERTANLYMASAFTRWSPWK